MRSNMHHNDNLRYILILISSGSSTARWAQSAALHLEMLCHNLLARSNAKGGQGTTPGGIWNVSK